MELFRKVWDILFNGPSTQEKAAYVLAPYMRRMNRNANNLVNAKDFAKAKKQAIYQIRETIRRTEEVEATYARTLAIFSDPELSISEALEQLKEDHMRSDNDLWITSFHLRELIRTDPTSAYLYLCDGVTLYRSLIKALKRYNDALHCSSNERQDMISAFFEAEGHYLHLQMGIQDFKATSVDKEITVKFGYRSLLVRTAVNLIQETEEKVPCAGIKLAVSQITSSLRAELQAANSDPETEIRCQRYAERVNALEELNNKIPEKFFECNDEAVRTGVELLRLAVHNE
ncbi:MAG: hypothetical protein S4CHLAM102_16310 [Chlamydiia bacterium]|nr:hypothetical protein [Chlamydiia bacterium]